MRTKVENKKDFIATVKALVVEDSSKWENLKSKDFLEALAAWLEDADGFYQNSGIQVDVEAPSWQLFADAIQAATIYE